MEETKNLEKSSGTKIVGCSSCMLFNCLYYKKDGLKFKQNYYSDDGYWRGKSAIQKLSKASDSTKEEAKK